MLHEGGQRKSGPEPWEAAEVRLAERAGRRANEEARRERRHRVVPWVVLAVAAALAAVGFLVVLDRAGGDLGAWSGGAAGALVVATAVVPALLAGLTGRRCGWSRFECLLLAAAAAGLALALAAGVGLVALGLGPS